MLAFGYAIGTYLSAPFETDPVASSCPVTMADIIQSAKGNVYEVNDPNYVEPDSHILVTYSVSGDEIVSPVIVPISSDLKDEQQNSASQEEAWQMFTTLIPAKDRRMIAQYLIFTDGSEETLAAVDQLPNDPTRWILEVDVADLENKDALLFTLIHEYAHLLTLNDSQVNIDQEVYKDRTNSSLLESKAAACPTYFTGIDCSHSDSYVNAFYQRFWVAITPEWKKIDVLQYEDDLNPYYAGLYNFYLTHQDQFVDDYSTTHPTEDIAESFTYFVFSPKPKGTSIRDQKILFFYEYPELIELRQFILQGTCSTVQ
jgi:hypothetical protein